MRPVASATNSVCPRFNAIIRPNQDQSVMIDVAKQAGYSNAASANVYYLKNCDLRECGYEFRLPHCVSGTCADSTNEIREIYVLCSSLAEHLDTSFEVLETRDVWSDSKSFLVSRVKLPSHKTSKQVDWCEEYRVFCASYDRRPYSPVGVLEWDTFDYGGCFWGYNATSYFSPIPSLTIVQDAGFTATSACVSGLNSCSFCENILTTSDCPLENCKGAVEDCEDYFIICT